MHTPNVDQLCCKSVVFTQAHSQQALCSPSRSSFLTGRRPLSTGIFSNDGYFRDNPGGENFVTLPGFFQENGYLTVGMGKIFHPKGNESELSFDEYYDCEDSYWTPENVDWKAVNDSREDHGPLPDELIRDQALKSLQAIADNEKEKEPFFMALGFHKPHLPWIFPKEYMDLYPLEAIDVPNNRYAPEEMPDIAWFSYHQLTHTDTALARGLDGSFNTTLPNDLIQEYRMAYYSCVSFIDDLVGDVLGKLHDLNLEDNTVVALVGDHGYSLGENAEWCKNTQFDLATHVPMTVHIPGMTDSGMVLDRLVELVDLFPTLVEAAGFPTGFLPSCSQGHQPGACHQGSSLMEIIRSPHKKGVPEEEEIFSSTMRHNSYLGCSVITPDYRYTKWVELDEGELVWNIVKAEELYDHKNDPDETRNVAYDKEYANVREDMHNRLYAGWNAGKL